MNVLANDGVSKNCVLKLEENGFKVIHDKVEQEELADYINAESIEVLLVRSATKVRKELIDNCPNLKFVGRGGVGMDNIDVEYAKSKGVQVTNTPAASSISVAEIVFAHLFSAARSLFKSNRSMPLEGDSKFKQLKKDYAKGIELRGKTIGIIGFGRIGQEVAKIGYGCGMNIIFCDNFLSEAKIKITFSDGQSICFTPLSVSLDELLGKSDYITLHVPSQKDYLLDEKEFIKMKDGVGIINAARGGVLNEESLIKFINSGKIKFAGLDTFENEPNPSIKTLMNSKLSLTPHIGAATSEAQERIGLELANQIISLVNN